MKCCKLFVPIALLALFSACTTTPAPGVGAVNHGRFTGTVEAYDLGPAELTATTFGEDGPVTVGSGSIRADGNFSFAFDDEPVVAALRPLADLFATPNCTDWANISDDKARGIWVERLDLIKGGRPEGVLARTTRKEVLTNGPRPGDAVAGWFYADREVRAGGECFDLSYTKLELNLEHGWNVVTTHYDNAGGTNTVTGAQPLGLRWFAWGVPIVYE